MLQAGSRVQEVNGRKRALAGFDFKGYLRVAPASLCCTWMCECRGRMDAQERPPWVTFDRSHPWLRPCGRTEVRPILFPTKLCFGKSHQNHSPRSARPLPPFLAPPGARPTRRAQTTRPGLDQKSREYSEAGCDDRYRTSLCYAAFAHPGQHSRRLRGLEQHLALPEFHSVGLAGFAGSVNTA